MTKIIPKVKLTVSNVSKKQIVPTDELGKFNKHADTLISNLRSSSNVDQRWLSIGITDIEKGILSLRHAIK